MDCLSLCLFRYFDLGESLEVCGNAIKNSFSGAGINNKLCGSVFLAIGAN